MKKVLASVLMVLYPASFVAGCYLTYQQIQLARIQLKKERDAQKND